MNEVLDGSVYTSDDLSETIIKLRSLADDLEAVCQGVMPVVPDVNRPGFAGDPNS